MHPLRRRTGSRLMTWGVTLALLVLSAAHLLAAAAANPAADPFALLSVALGIAGILTAARLATAGCIESRVAATLVAGATFVGLILIHTVGLPGIRPTIWSARDVALLLLSTGVVAAVGLFIGS